MPPGKITVSWDEVSSPVVDEKLRRQEEESGGPLPEPSAPVDAGQQKAGLLYNGLVYMSLFGLVGGLLGWVCGNVMHLRPDPRREAQSLIQNYQEVVDAWHARQLSDDQAQVVLKELRREGVSNPYFRNYVNPKLTEDQKSEVAARLDNEDAWKDRIANVLFYGVSGLCIALALAVAEPVVERNWPRALINGCVGAMLGLVGGGVVSMLIDPLHAAIVPSDGATTMQKVVGRAITWGVLGLFLSAAPGVVMWNWKKLLCGLVGGLVGGLIGGALYEPVSLVMNNEQVSKLVPILAIGLIAGLGTGLIENAAKQGWVRVVQGLIAGKQFILYRNPTYIGNSLQCHIYLFKDPQVGRRHAAVHLVPGGFEIEDLPLGGATYVNNKPVRGRSRLRNGDQVRIGSTVFLFQEKAHASA